MRTYVLVATFAMTLIAAGSASVFGHILQGQERTYAVKPANFARFIYYDPSTISLTYDAKKGKTNRQSSLIRYLYGVGSFSSNTTTQCSGAGGLTSTTKWSKLYTFFPLARPTYSLVVKRAPSGVCGSCKAESKLVFSMNEPGPQTCTVTTVFDYYAQGTYTATLTVNEI